MNATDLFDRYLYSSGDLACSLNPPEPPYFLLTSCRLLPEYDDIVEDSLPNFEVSDVSIEQSIQAPLTPTDTATLSGSLTVTLTLTLTLTLYLLPHCRPRLHE